MIYARARPRADGEAGAEAASAAAPARPRPDPRPPARAAPTAAELTSGGPRVVLSSARLETLLRTLGESLEVGLTFAQYAEGPVPPGLGRGLATALAAEARAGRPPSQALARLRLIDAPTAAVLAASELRGEGPAALAAIADRELEAREFRDRLVRTLAYPALVLLASTLLGPLPRLFLAGPAVYLREVAGALAGPVAVLAVVLGVVPRLDPDGPVRAGLRSLAARLPPMSAIVRTRARASFCDVLGAGIAAGLGIRHALALAAGASADPRLRAEEAALVGRIDDGDTLAEALAARRVLADEDLAQVGHGEAVGKLDGVLARIARRHHARARSQLVAATVAAGTVLGLWVFIQVALTVVRGWQSYFSTLDSLIGM